MRLGLYALSTIMLLAALANPNKASAADDCTDSCEGIFDEGSASCNGNPNCLYELEFCTFGCTCGTCVSHGGSGLCCGETKYTPAVYPNGEGGCGSECGDAVRIHARSHPDRLHSSDWYKSELREDHTPGLVLLSEQVLYRPPVFAFAWSRCRHRFSLLTE